MKQNKAVKKSRIKIKWNIFLWLAGFTGVILMILWLCQVVFLDNIYKSIKTSTIMRSAKMITEKIDSANFQSEAELIAAQNDMCVLILKMIDENTATEVASVKIIQNCVIHNTDENSKFILYDAAKANGGSLLQRFRYDAVNRAYYRVGHTERASDDAESIVYTFIITNKQGENILVMLNSIISPVSATVDTLNSLLTVISVVLLTLALLLALIISRQISKPIVRINNAAKQLAMRNYDVKFDQRGYREIAELGETMNYATKELSKVDTLYRELIANISHDLRTPLTMITGYSEVMRDLPGEITQENIQIIIDEANRLTSLVNDVLDISKFQSGTENFEARRFNLTDAVRNAMTRYNKLIERDGYQITFLCDEDIFVNSDEHRIMQVLYNLVNNAITYTGADKRVTIRQTVTNNTVRISVSDTGEGIPADKLDLIWERYYKIDKQHRRAAMGTGLGLSIVKSIINLAGGRCGAESQVGMGSTFWFELKTEEASIVNQ